MSISNLFQDNTYDLHCENMTVTNLSTTNSVVISGYTGGGSTSALINNAGAIIRGGGPVAGGFANANVQVTPNLTTGVGAPSFTVPLGAQPEGTWIKVTGLVASGFETNCTYGSGTFTVGLTGVWRFDVSISGVRASATGDRFVFLTLQRNVTDANQVLTTYSPCFAGNSFRSTNDLYSFSNTKILSLTAGDTVKPFMAMTHSAGASVADVEVHAMSITATFIA